MSKAFLYNRVSHKYSAESGISIEEQNFQGQAYAKMISPDLEVISVNDEAVSAWSKSFATRPGGRKILAEAKEGDHIICYRIDRLARNLRDFCNTNYYFQNAGINVHYVANQINTSTSTGKLQANVMAAMAQYASDITSERTREALLIKRLKNKESSGKKKMVWEKSEFGIQPTPKTLRFRNKIHSYERVSTEAQYISGLGLEYQTMALKKASEKLSLEGGKIGNLYSDPAISAFSVPFGERPAGRKLLEDLQPGDDVIIYRLDRGWRNTLDAIETIDLITSRGAFIHFVCEGIRTDSTGGKEWINLLASIAQLESQMRSQRILDAMARCRASGRPTALPRFGMRVTQVTERQKKLSVDKHQALEAAQIWLLKNEYDLKPTQIEEMILAIRARKANKPASLTMMKRTPIERKLTQIKAFEKMIGPSLWRKWLDKGRVSLKEPFEPCHLRLIRSWTWTNHSDAAETHQSAFA